MQRGTDAVGLSIGWTHLPAAAACVRVYLAQIQGSRAVISGVTGAELAASGCPPHHRVLGECQRQDPLLCLPLPRLVFSPQSRSYSPPPISTDICIFIYLQNVSFLTFDAQRKRITFWWHSLYLLLKLCIKFVLQQNPI